MATGTNQINPVKLDSAWSHLRSRDGAMVEVNHVEPGPHDFNVLVNTENRDIGSVAADIQKRLTADLAKLPRGHVHQAQGRIRPA